MFLVYTGMTFVYCQLTEERHLGVANFHRNGICIWSTYRNSIVLRVTYVGMAFVCCQLNTGLCVVPPSVLFHRQMETTGRPVPCLQNKPAG